MTAVLVGAFGCCRAVFYLIKVCDVVKDKVNADFAFTNSVMRDSPLLGISGDLSEEIPLSNYGTKNKFSESFPNYVRVDSGEVHYFRYIDIISEGNLSNLVKRNNLWSIKS